MICPKMIFGTLVLSATMFAQTQPSSAPQAPAAPAKQQQNHLKSARHGDWLKKYKDLPPDQQKAALENDPNFKKLPPERQEKLRQRLPPVHKTPPEPPEKNGNSHRR